MNEATAVPKLTVRREIAAPAKELFDAWRSRLATIGQAVQIRLPHAVLAGHAEGIDPSGALLVRDAAGTLHRVTAGDVEA